MTQAFNLSQLANFVNTSGQLNASTGLYNQASVANGGTGLSTLTANNVILGNGTSAVQFVAPGTSGNILTSNGTTWLSQAVSLIPQIQTQTLSVGSSTWSKPTTGGYQWIYIQIWGGGGSGNKLGTSSGGGGGGGYNELIVPLSFLAASESYTVGSGGAGVTTATGNTGGTSSFTVTNYPVKGSITLQAFGGAGGTTSGGGGGSAFSAGSGVVGGAGMYGFGNSTQIQDGIPNQLTRVWEGARGSTGANLNAGSSYYGGGGGSFGGGTGYAGYAAYGGGGGGSCNNASGLNPPGQSIFGGNGSAGTATTVPSAGSVPGGGGGGTRAGTTSGAGGAGQIILTWW
jgi:hypothetical protein